ncbi:MAG: hypothetical protein K0R25_393 [Rickettsiaceae bacterium]|jgi:hypothetical protein|nr:hypothetical protein [Rickettsiaceae bacterium]
MPPNNKSIPNKPLSERELSLKIHQNVKANKSDPGLTEEQITPSIRHFLYNLDKAKPFDHRAAQKVINLCSKVLLINKLKKDPAKNDDGTFTTESYALCIMGWAFYLQAKHLTEDEKKLGLESEKYRTLLLQSCSCFLTCMQLTEEKLPRQFFNIVMKELRLKRSCFEVEPTVKIKDGKFVQRPSSDMDKKIYAAAGYDGSRGNILDLIYIRKEGYKGTNFLSIGNNILDPCMGYINPRLEGGKLREDLSSDEKEVIAYARHGLGLFDYYWVMHLLQNSLHDTCRASELVTTTIKEKIDRAGGHFAESHRLYLEVEKQDAAEVLSRNLKIVKNTISALNGQIKKIEWPAVVVEEEKQGGQDAPKLPDSLPEQSQPAPQIPELSLAQPTADEQKFVESSHGPNSLSQEQLIRAGSDAVEDREVVMRIQQPQQPVAPVVQSFNFGQTTGLADMPILRFEAGSSQEGKRVITSRKEYNISFSAQSVADSGADFAPKQENRPRDEEVKGEGSKIQELQDSSSSQLQSAPQGHELVSPISQLDTRQEELCLNEIKDSLDLSHIIEPSEKLKEQDLKKQKELEEKKKEIEALKIKHEVALKEQQEKFEAQKLAEEVQKTESGEKHQAELNKRDAELIELRRELEEQRAQKKAALEAMEMQKAESNEKQERSKEEMRKQEAKFKEKLEKQKAELNEERERLKAQKVANQREEAVQKSEENQKRQELEMLKASTTEQHEKSEQKLAVQRAEYENSESMLKEAQKHKAEAEEYEKSAQKLLRQGREENEQSVKQLTKESEESLRELEKDYQYSLKELQQRQKEFEEYKRRVQEFSRQVTQAEERHQKSVLAFKAKENDLKQLQAEVEVAKAAISEQNEKLAAKSEAIEEEKSKVEKHKKSVLEFSIRETEKYQRSMMKLEEIEARLQEEQGRLESWKRGLLKSAQIFAEERQKLEEEKRTLEKKKRTLEKLRERMANNIKEAEKEQGAKLSENYLNSRGVETFLPKEPTENLEVDVRVPNDNEAVQELKEMSQGEPKEFAAESDIKPSEEIENIISDKPESHKISSEPESEEAKGQSVLVPRKQKGGAPYRRVTYSIPADDPSEEASKRSVATSGKEPSRSRPTINRQVAVKGIKEIIGSQSAPQPAESYGSIKIAKRGEAIEIFDDAKIAEGVAREAEKRAKKKEQFALQNEAAEKRREKEKQYDLGQQQDSQPRSHGVFEGDKVEAYAEPTKVGEDSESQNEIPENFPSLGSVDSSEMSQMTKGFVNPVSDRTYSNVLSSGANKPKSSSDSSQISRTSGESQASNAHKGASTTKDFPPLPEPAAPGALSNLAATGSGAKVITIPSLPQMGVRNKERYRTLGRGADNKPPSSVKPTMGRGIAPSSIKQNEL